MVLCTFRSVEPGICPGSGRLGCGVSNVKRRFDWETTWLAWQSEAQAGSRFTFWVSVVVTSHILEFQTWIFIVYEYSSPARSRMVHKTPKTSTYRLWYHFPCLSINRFLLNTHSLQPPQIWQEEQLHSGYCHCFQL
jgi:hypothetical protein